MGGKVVTISGPDGYIYDEKGISGKKIDYMLELRASSNDVVKPFADKFPESTFIPNKRPWEVKVDVAIPCATQNELDEQDAQKLVNNGVFCVTEGANMPCTLKAAEIFLGNHILYAPGKAANAGGVAVSGLEMSQNSIRLSWTREEVNEKLKGIMRAIHNQCVDAAKTYDDHGDWINYLNGANIAGFIKVANAMMDQGLV